MYKYSTITLQYTGSTPLLMHGRVVTFSSIRDAARWLHTHGYSKSIATAKRGLYAVLSEKHPLKTYKEFVVTT